MISAHCTYPCFSDAPITKVLADRADGAKHTIKIPASCLDNGALEFDHINTPFLIYTEGAAGGGVRERPLGAGSGEGRGRAQLR